MGRTSDALRRRWDASPDGRGRRASERTVHWWSRSAVQSCAANPDPVLWSRSLLFDTTLPLGVIGNTSDSDSEESWFDPRRGNCGFGRGSQVVTATVC